VERADFPRVFFSEFWPDFSMKRFAIAGLAAGAAMMIGGAVGAVYNSNPSAADRMMPHSEMMNPMVGGQAMLAGHTLLENISASPDHSSLVAAMKESGIADALTSKGQFTLFAPANSALAALSSQTHDKARLARLMGYLVVPGKYDSPALLKAIAAGGGEARLRTVEGGVLVARMNGPTNIILVDGNGNTADIAVYDVYNRNGVLHVVDHMLQPGAANRQVAANAASG
jgi:uncharacterized surface protein with fasciclin (FAS1) repeats